MSLASSSLQAGSLPESLGKPCSNVYPQSFLRKTNRCHNSLKFVSMACHVGVGGDLSSQTKDGNCAFGSMEP